VLWSELSAGRGLLSLLGLLSTILMPSWTVVVTRFSDPFCAVSSSQPWVGIPREAQKAGTMEEG
jgi:hypothetical protein